MLKEKYERSALEVIRFYTDDIITTTGIPYEGWNTYDQAGNGGDEYEGWVTGGSGGDPYEGTMTSP